MKWFLIAVIIAQYLGALSGLFFAPPPPRMLWFGLLGVVLFNGLCAWFLYTRAARKRVEWALFGFIANYIAVLIYWVSRPNRA
jgi:hypothetical protein